MSPLFNNSMTSGTEWMGRGNKGGGAGEGEEGEQGRGLLPSAQRLLLVAIPVQANQGGGSSPHSSHSGKSKN